METSETLQWILENPILVVLAIPAATAVLALIAGRPIRSMPGIVAIVGTLAVLGAAIRLASKAFSVPLSTRIAPEAWTLTIGGQESQPAWELALTFRADALTATMAVGLSLLFLIAALISYDLRRVHHLSPGYFFFLLLAATGACGVALAGDLLTLYIAWELTTLAVAALVLVPLRPNNASAAGKMLAASFATSVPMLGAVIWLLSARGSLDIQGLLERPVSLDSPVALAAALALVITFIVRAGLIPAHAWLVKAADSAIAPANLILTTALTITGAYSMARISFAAFAFDANWMLALGAVGAVSAILGPIGAMRSERPGTVLAYLAIGQMGLVAIPLALATPTGLTAAFSQMVGFAVYFPLLAIAVSLLGRSGASGRRLSDIALSAPAAFLALAVGLLGMAAIPPLNGFAPRVLVFQTLLGAGNTAALLSLAAAVLSTALIAAASIDVLARVARAQSVAAESTRPSSAGSKLAIAILAILSLGTGVAPNIVLSNLGQPLAAAAQAQGRPVIASAVRFDAWVEIAATTLLALAVALGSMAYLRQRQLLENSTVPYARAASAATAPIAIFAPVYRALGFLIERNALDATLLFRGALNVAATAAGGIVFLLAARHAPDAEAVWDFEEEETGIEEPRIAA